MKNAKPTRNKFDPTPYVVGAIALLLLCMLVLSGSCNEQCPKRNTIEIVIQVDLTEAQIAKPDANEIIGLYGLDTNKWDGAEFSYADLTDVSFNRRTTFSLAPGGNRLTSSGFTRDREVEKFEDSIRSFFAARAVDTVGRPHSSVYLPIANELNRLSESHSAERTLIVYSDLMENDKTVSFYDKKTIGSLRTDPNKITAMLIAKADLKDLTGISVYLIFQPENAAQDELFRLVAGFYQTLLESHGAKVIVAANVIAQTNQ